MGTQHPTDTPHHWSQARTAFHLLMGIQRPLSHCPTATLLRMDAQLMPLPMATTHLLLPTAILHLQLPTAILRLRLPTATLHLRLPTATLNLRLPTATLTHTVRGPMCPAFTT